MRETTAIVCLLGVGLAVVGACAWAEWIFGNVLARRFWRGSASARLVYVGGIGIVFVAIIVAAFFSMCGSILVTLPFWVGTIAGIGNADVQRSHSARSSWRGPVRVVEGRPINSHHILPSVGQAQMPIANASWVWRLLAVAFLGGVFGIVILIGGGGTPAVVQTATAASTDAYFAAPASPQPQPEAFVANRYVTIHSSPPGARIESHGVTVGHAPTNFSAGVRTSVTLRLDGCHSRRFTIERSLAAGDYRVDLEPRRHTR